MPPDTPAAPLADAAASGPEQTGGASFRARGLSRLSGGLDSLLAICMLREQGCYVEAITFASPFFNVEPARKGDAQLLDIPVTALAVLMLCAFWVCVPLLVVGLFAGCRYSFSGKELDRENLNRALDKVADAAGSLKKSVTQA